MTQPTDDDARLAEIRKRHAMADGDGWRSGQHDTAAFLLRLLDQARADFRHTSDQCDTLAAKLAKAKEALEAIADGEQDASIIASQTLAYIFDDTGGRDDRAAEARADERKKLVAMLRESGDTAIDKVANLIIAGKFDNLSPCEDDARAILAVLADLLESAP